LNYETARRTSIPSTFDKTIAEGLIGSRMTGDVVRVQVDAYDFVDKRTGDGKYAVVDHSIAFCFDPFSC